MIVHYCLAIAALAALVLGQAKYLGLVAACVALVERLGLEKPNARGTYMDQLKGACSPEMAISWPISLVVLAITYLLHFPYYLYVLLVLSGIVQFYPGLKFYRGFVDAVKKQGNQHGHAHSDRHQRGVVV